MIATIDVKDARIEVKTSKDIKVLLQTASNSLGMDLSSFLISIATQRAKEVLKEDKLLALSNKDWKEFNDLLKEPKQPTDALKELMKQKDFDA